jgi:hypothetical protein
VVKLVFITFYHKTICCTSKIGSKYCTGNPFKKYTAIEIIPFFNPIFVDRMFKVEEEEDEDEEDEDEEDEEESM